MITLDFDSVKRKVVLNTEHIQLIREHLSVEDKNAFFYRRGNPYGKKPRHYLITPAGRFDINLLPDVFNAIREKCPHEQITTTVELKKQIEALKDAQGSVVELNPPLRDYQKEAVQKALTFKNGILLLATSAGKTLITAALIASLLKHDTKRKIFLLVPDVQLVNQSYKDFISYGLDKHATITKWTGVDEPQQDATVCIANTQILLSENQDKSMFYNADVLIVDEVHKCKKGNKIAKLLKTDKTKNKKIGLTGTLPSEKEQEWFIKGLIGPVLYTKESSELREQKFITDVVVHVLRVKYKHIPTFTQSKLSDPTVEYNEEQEWLQTNNERNKVMLSVIKSLQNNTLVLVDRITHGKHLEEFFRNNLPDKKVFFIHGEVDVEEREKVRELMETDNNIVCVAISKLFSTGINIKALSNIVFASIGKAKIKIVQSIGRSLRLHKNKKIAKVIDIADVTKYGNKHLTERLNVYKEQKIEYKITILNV